MSQVASLYPETVRLSISRSDHWSQVGKPIGSKKSSSEPVLAQNYLRVQNPNRPRLLELFLRITCRLVADEHDTESLHRGTYLNYIESRVNIEASCLSRGTEKGAKGMLRLNKRVRGLSRGLSIGLGVCAAEGEHVQTRIQSR